MLSVLDLCYLFGFLFYQVQLDFIYSYYKLGKNEEMFVIIDRFICLNLNYLDVDYVYYMCGLINMELDSNFF